MSCIFCTICEGKDDKTTLLYQDEQLAVFQDIKPASTHHYLVCPREHISDAKKLQYKHLPLVERMVEVGRQVLLEHEGNPEEARFGFHWPPFHIVTHLHLHVIAPESAMGLISRGIFKKDSWWFVTPEYMIDRLKKLPAETQE